MQVSQILAKLTLVTDYKVIYFSVVLVAHKSSTISVSEVRDKDSPKLFPPIFISSCYYVALMIYNIFLRFPLENYSLCKEKLYPEQHWES